MEECNHSTAALTALVHANVDAVDAVVAVVGAGTPVDVDVDVDVDGSDGLVQRGMLARSRTWYYPYPPCHP